MSGVRNFQYRACLAELEKDCASARPSLAAEFVRTCLPAREREHRSSEVVGELFLSIPEGESVLINLGWSEQPSLLTEDHIQACIRSIIQQKLGAIPASKNAKIRQDEQILTPTVRNS